MKSQTSQDTFFLVEEEYTERGKKVYWYHQAKSEKAAKDLIAHFRDERYSQRMSPDANFTILCVGTKWAKKIEEAEIPVDRKG